MHNVTLAFHLLQNESGCGLIVLVILKLFLSVENQPYFGMGRSLHCSDNAGCGLLNFL